MSVRAGKTSAREDPAVRPTPSRLLAATVIVAIAAMLGACAQPEPEATGAPERPEALPSAELTPTPAATGAPGTATPPAAVELVDFATRTGTMRMRVPSTWTVEDESHMTVDWEGERRWDSFVRFMGDGDGYLWYSDAMADDVRATPVELEVVEAIAMADGNAATAWSERDDEGAFRAGVAVVPLDAAGSSMFRVQGSARLHQLLYQHPWGGPAYATRAEAEAFLRSPAVRLALDVMATAEFVPDDDAFPADIAVEHEGTTYLPMTTKNGSATFLVPEQWTITELSRYEPSDGTWVNAIQLELPSGHPVLSYHDGAIRSPVQEGAWTVGEVRPTATDGWSAVSWAFDEPGQRDRGTIGVDLVAEVGPAHPTGQICTPAICRSFSSFPLGDHRDDTSLDEADEFFGSELEEQMLTVVASLEAHHDDPRRMP